MLLPLQSLLGLAVLVGLSWALSEKRSAFDWKLVAVALAVQVGLALVLLRVPVVSHALQSLNVVVTALMTATDAGTSFVFGYVGGADAPFEVTNPGGMYSLAFQALPLVLVTAALTALLWHWGILRLSGIGGLAGGHHVPAVYFADDLRHVRLCEPWQRGDDDFCAFNARPGTARRCGEPWHEVLARRQFRYADDRRGGRASHIRHAGLSFPHALDSFHIARGPCGLCAASGGARHD